MPQFPMSFNFPGPFNLKGIPGDVYVSAVDASGVLENAELVEGSNITITKNTDGTVTLAASGDLSTDQTILTATNETATLPNSRQLLAGTNVTFDVSVPNELTINASGGGGSGLTINPTPYTVSTVTLTGSEANYLIFDVTSNSIIVNLPASSGHENKIYYLEVIDPSFTGNALIVTPNGTDNINPEGNTSLVLFASSGPLGLMADGTATWYQLQLDALNGLGGSTNGILTNNAGNVRPLSLAPGAFLYHSATSNSQSNGSLVSQAGLAALNGTIHTSGTSLNGVEASYHILDGTSGAVNIVLPQTNSQFNGKVYLFRCINSTHTVTITADTTNPDTIEGNPSVTMVAGQIFAIMCDNAHEEWRYVVKNQWNLTTDVTSVLPTSHGGTGSGFFTYGQATFLSSGSIAVADSSITSSSIITLAESGTTPVVESFSVELTPGTGFTIHSSNPTSTAVVNYIRVA